MHVHLVFAFLIAVATSAASAASEPLARFESALAHYRALADTGGWPIVAGGPVMGLGDEGPRVIALRRRLQRTSDLVDSATSNRYDGGVQEAVMRFQARHGLAIDGRVGVQTTAALNVSAAARAAQLALNMERWRRLPPFAPTHIRVNIAAALLDVVEDGRLVSTMPVVVGDPKHQTPAFSATIVAVTFNPPWNVPRSIATHEILPRLRRDPGYLAANDIHILDRPQDPFGRNIDWRRIAGFPFRLQQQPGPRNSLGLIKFEMPNAFDVYLHDTPTKALFDRPKRTLSHGCIRVSRPYELAQFVLRRGTWTRAAIDAVIAGGHTQHVPVEPPVPVHVIYLTAFVDDAGTVQFRDDVYGRDGLRAAAKPVPTECSF